MSALIRGVDIQDVRLSVDEIAVDGPSHTLIFSGDEYDEIMAGLADVINKIADRKIGKDR